jgi:flagellar biosynthetic protein FlhB
VSETHGSESRTEQPTARRLEKARQEGSVLRAHGLAAGVILVTGAAALSLGGARLVELLELSLLRGLSFDPNIVQTPDRLLAAAGRVVIPGIEVVAPFLIMMAAVGFIADIMVGGWIFSARPLSPDFSRIGPVRGFQRLLSRAALVEILKALVKFGIVGVIAFWLIRTWGTGFLQTAAATWPRAAEHAVLFWRRIFLVLSVSLLAAAALEVPYQVWAHRDRLKMTRQDIKEELRELDGSPQTKRRIKILRRKIARMRMAVEVPKADVVVTNPEHYAAALQYRDGEMRAPRLVAKGTGLVALRIREIAAEHGVPMIEAPRLARAIYRFVELEDEIPTGLYAAVAEVLAYVYRLRAARNTRGPAPPLQRDERFEPPAEFTTDE